ncbi:MAG: SusD/RagB family nutrient-binding outer membrane lipoprotein [Bacteroidetes bacterium]|nr:SusD/RagB family nutrient-binding outer membrane lipoprotein [Bacteroidota bacterium]
MKKILAFLTILLIFSACKKLELLNENTKDPTNVTGESLFTGAQKNLFDQMTTPNVNFNIWRMFTQQWTETTYLDEANYNIDNRPIPLNHWNVLYRDVLKDLSQSATIISSTSYLDPDPAIKVNKLAVVEIMTVYTWSVLVETFGNIPYTQALNVNNVNPVYDDGLTVYKDLINRLNAAIGKLNPAWGSLGTADNMYQGDVTNWLKFANSLKLRMGLLLADIPSEASFVKTTVESAAPGVISSNADIAKLVYLGAQPNTNPVYDNLVASGRNDFVAANTLVDSMNNLADPRRQFYFTQVDTSTSGTPKLAYVGGIYGESNNFFSYSHVADQIEAPTFEAMIFDYAETEFLLAEAVERGFSVGGTAADHYNTAIKASIAYWGGTEADAAAYLSNPRVAYATAAGTFREKIGMQLWFALYNRGFESWTEWRRFDYPLLVAPPEALSVIPLRLTYPTTEQTLNGANWAAASTAIGGDAVSTKLFWDKN